jgi:4-hydroxy-tetrahydrodipicolinate synthase
LQLKGSITALTTPFSISGLIDLNAWRAQIDVQLNAGSSGVVVAGSTGEAANLSDEEYCQLIELASIRIGSRAMILAGTGLSSTSKTIRQNKLAKRTGAHAALVVTPPYVRPTQAGLIAHYQAVAEASEIPVVLYNVPGRTGGDLLPETVAVLSSHENIIGLKEAVADESRWQALYPLASPHFSLLSGDDGTFVRAMEVGAHGVVSVASNAVPATFARICRHLEERNMDAAYALDGRLRELYDFLGVEPNPIPIKAIMQIMGFGHGLRLPLLPLSDDYKGKAEEMADLCKTIEQST